MIPDFARYLTAERRYSPLTVRNYCHDVEQFALWKAGSVEAFEPETVTTKDVRNWILYRTDVGKIGAASMNREVSSLRAFFHWLLRSGELQKDVTRGISALHKPQRLPAFVPESRMKTVVADCEELTTDFEQERNAVIILLFYACGLRLAELVGCNRDDFSADYSSLRVLGKGNKERLVPVLDFVREKIFCYLDQIERQNICKSEEKALILTLKGERISRSTVYRVVQRVLEHAGVQGKKSPHVLRHTFATHLLNGGADIREIQELLGHTSLLATQVYTHNSITKLREIYTKAHPHGGEGGR